mmetsp:Transcript_60873/g.125419  ORF Transcript_60873/g.125419 Transcript_60873/m.125419 type:complete len:210 (-) Transcript_60873:1036-1665(-)
MPLKGGFKRRNVTPFRVSALLRPFVLFLTNTIHPLATPGKLPFQRDPVPSNVGDINRGWMVDVIPGCIATPHDLGVTPLHQQAGIPYAHVIPMAFEQLGTQRLRKRIRSVLLRVDRDQRDRCIVIRLPDEVVPACNMLRHSVVNRVLGKSHRCFVVLVYRCRHLLLEAGELQDLTQIQYLFARECCLHVFALARRKCCQPLQSGAPTYG